MELVEGVGEFGAGGGIEPHDGTDEAQIGAVEGVVTESLGSLNAHLLEPGPGQGVPGTGGQVGPELVGQVRGPGGRIQVLGGAATLSGLDELDELGGGELTHVVADRAEGLVELVGELAGAGDPSAQRGQDSPAQWMGQRARHLRVGDVDDACHVVLLSSRTGLLSSRTAVCSSDFSVMRDARVGDQEETTMAQDVTQDQAHQVQDCLLCRGADGDGELLRTEVWSNELWRLATGVTGDPSPGFSYLEPRRHISDITTMDGPEAASFGTVLAHCARVLKDVTDAELIYVYVFGGSIPHLHVHLAPHRSGDGWNDELLKGPLEITTLPSGVQLQANPDYPPAPDEQLQRVADDARARLAADPPPVPV